MAPHFFLLFRGLSLAFPSVVYLLFVTYQHILVTINMSDVQAKIAELEAEMARTQKNKATNYHLGTLKAKIAKLKSELINGPGGKSSGTKNAERGFDVTKSGDTRIGLVGFPSVGKSTLLTALTGTRSEAAAYEFTTLTCIPYVELALVYVGLL